MIAYTIKRFLLDWEPGYKIDAQNTFNNGSWIVNESMREMDDWCLEHCTGRYQIGRNFGRFELANDAILFALTWK
jgi:hypothetical protein